MTLTSYANTAGARQLFDDVGATIEAKNNILNGMSHAGAGNADVRIPNFFCHQLSMTVLVPSPPKLRTE